MERNLHYERKEGVFDA